MNQESTYRSPLIVRESSSGLERLSIFDQMRTRRALGITGPIEGAMAFDICQQVLEFEREDPNAEVTVYVSSNGGEVAAGLAIYDVMRQVSCPVRTVCMDIAASMGSIVFIAGDRREMLPHAELMIHDPLIPSGAGGSALQLEKTSKKLMETRRTLNTILSERSGLSLKRVQSLTGKESYLSADKAVELGFAHSVVQSAKDASAAPQTKKEN